MDEDAPSLFRSEVLAATSTRRFGNVLIHQPWGYRLAALLAAALTLLILAFAWWGTYTRKTTVNGLLTPEQGLLRLTASAVGMLSEIHVSEGDEVAAGEPLFVISGERRSVAGATQALIADQLQQRMSLLSRNRALAERRLAGQLRALASRQASLAAELEQFRLEIHLLDQREALAQAHQLRQQELVEAGFISEAQLEQAEAELLTLQSQQQSVYRARSHLQREQSDLTAQRREAELQHRAEIAEIDNAIALLRQEQAEHGVRSELVIVAPFSGTVTGMTAQVGQQAAAGTLLASLVPQGATLVAHLYAAPRQAGFIQPGQRVLMRYSAYPYQKFGMAGGEVTDVAKSPYAAQELPPHIANAAQSPTLPAELFYKVTVALDSPTINVYGQPQRLKAGMLLEADIVQEKRRLYEWALEPIYSVTGKMRF